MTSAGLTVSEKEPVLVPPALSVTVAMKLMGPAESGMPESSPVVLMLSPVPLNPVAAHTNGATPVPAVTANCCEYEVPTAAAGSVAGVAMVTAGAIDPVNCWLPVSGLGLVASVATTVYW
jgi:hypothetical protein